MEGGEKMATMHDLILLSFPPADDEKYSPQLTNAPDVEGILHNKSEVPVVAPDEAVNEAVVNAFEQIQPLDDLSLRRKSLQLTPSGSQSNSNRGSR